jgi:hypothetical protein
MSLYYITKKESETGKKFNDVFVKFVSIREAQLDLCEKYKFRKLREQSSLAFGGITSCGGFEKTPDSKIWKKLKTANGTDDEYFPKKSSKEGKKILDEFKQISILPYSELNECIGFNDAFGSIGFYQNEEFFGFSLNEKWNFKVPDNCEEITTTRFNELFRTKEHSK